VADAAYAFDGVDDIITLQTPFATAIADFSLSTWVKPTLVNDGAWHGFLGYQDGTRSPSLWVNFNGCDVGFCDCSGTSGGITSWDCLVCSDGDAGCTCTTVEAAAASCSTDCTLDAAGTSCMVDAGTDPHTVCTLTPAVTGSVTCTSDGSLCSTNGSNNITPTPDSPLPSGDCVADAEITQSCTTAVCCDCSTANIGNAGDGVSGNGMHWDTRTTQAANGNMHAGVRFAGVADNYFEDSVYTHIVWAKIGQECTFYKNGALTETTVCPTHVDLHETYEVGHVDNFFTGVIDEVTFYTFPV
jgi:hypothetical protein